MLHSYKRARGSQIESAEGPVGSIVDMFFEDDTWVVRYYVADIGPRKVLIAPGSEGKITREQVLHSPDVDTARPISRQAEASLYKHYGWLPYWIPLEPAVPFAEGDAEEREEEAKKGYRGGDPHLRSMEDVRGYHLSATDGEIGHVEDFLYDDENVRVRFLVAETKNWLPGKLVLIAPDWIEDVKWSESKVFVKVTRDAVKHSPEYDPAITVDRRYQEELYEHYDFPLPML